MLDLQHNLKLDSLYISSLARVDIPENLAQLQRLRLGETNYSWMQGLLRIEFQNHIAFSEEIDAKFIV